MIRYSIMWWDGRNPIFPDYHDLGGDCTNFVSQMMLMGGWETAGPPGQATRSKWFWGSTVDDCSFTWGAANNFHSFAITYSQRLEVVGNVYWCQDSDIVQYDWTADNSIDHTQFVTNNVYNEQTVELYMTQHDNDYLNRPISEILADLSRTYPNFRTYGMSHTVW
jgi:Putative amidase domain